MCSSDTKAIWRISLWHLFLRIFIYSYFISLFMSISLMTSKAKPPRSSGAGEDYYRLIFANSGEDNICLY